MTTWIILGILALLIILVAGLYNKLVSLRNRFRNAFAQIDVQLKRRYDLIPNLVETARGYLRHERETLEAVIAARSKAIDASKLAADSPGSADAMKGLAAADNALTRALSRLIAVAESYPDLKANQTMQILMEELTSTENKVAFARQAFNDAVTEYNIACERFPEGVVARLFGFMPANLLESIESPDERKAPKVQF